MPRMPAPRPLALALCAVCAPTATGCGPLESFFRGEAPSTARAAALPIADPGFPAGYRRWVTADAVPDENAGTIHRLYRAPDTAADRKGRYPVGAVLVKEHVVPGEDDLIVRLDVRRRLANGTYGGWEYESYDPATHKRMQIDAEACDLCHQTAPADATFTTFPGR